MRKYIKAGLCTAFACLMLFAAGCLPAGLSADAARRPQPTFNCNAWVTYWDFDRGLKEAMKIQSQLNSVSYFAAAFDGKNRLLMIGPVNRFTNQKFTRYRTEIKKFLTVVNDVHKDIHNPQGQSIEKDTQLLFILFDNDEAIKAHINELMSCVKRYKFDGLEIDYENIWKTPRLADRYVRFLHMLAPAAEEAKVPLRVILEPGIPVDDYKLPEGPEYVMMCYNLFGTHSANGGPKADTDFLEKMLKKASRLPRPHSVALATGGCIWQEGKRPCFVTEEEALEHAKKLKAKISRDPFSVALYFNAPGAGGKNVECWFADAKTIIAWKRQAMDYGVDGISLWRLGGNYKIENYYPGVLKTSKE